MRSYKTLKDQLPDEEALFSIMHGYYDELFRYGVRFTADVEETKGCPQSILYSYMDNRDKMEEVVENFKAYIFVSYKRWLITHLKNLQKVRPLFLEGGPSGEPCELSFEETLIARVRDKEIKKLSKEAITSLSPRQRQLL
jgi:DNA-directed RNA polymerase specialized sigma24 family protein